jgi:molecular chaperone HtpG
MNHFHFNVNFKGLIDLLSNHLYSTPNIYIRELIQNAVDAITARKKINPDHQGRVEMELYSSENRLPDWSNIQKRG